MIKDGERIFDTKIRSFLMIGQSNMAGRGEFNQVPNIENANCYMVRNGRWQKMSEPINPDRPIFEGEFHSGISLAASFADSVSKQLNCKVGLIPCADGGTEIDEWQKGGVLYEHALFMAKLARKNSVLSGIIWHQGESDARSTDELAISHKEKFLKMINHLRADLGQENLPVIVGELSNCYTDRWNLGERPKIINDGYFQATKHLSNCALVSADGLKLKADGIHFNSVSLREFGLRYATAYLKLIRE